MAALILNGPLKALEDSGHVSGAAGDSDGSGDRAGVSASEAAAGVCHCLLPNGIVIWGPTAKREVCRLTGLLAEGLRVGSGVATGHHPVCRQATGLQ